MRLAAARQKEIVALRLRNPRSCKSPSASLVSKDMAGCANFHSYKDLMGDARCLLELPETCHSQFQTIGILIGDDLS
jgi:hypothetical protein